jgi:hypothetical protein
VVIKKQRLGAALSLIVTSAQADEVDVPLICLGLRMHGRVPVNLAGGSLQDSCASLARKVEHVDRAQHIGANRAHGIGLVLHRRGGAGEIVDLIDVDRERSGHVMRHGCESRLSDEVPDILHPAGQLVVRTDDLMPVL